MIKLVYLIFTILLSFSKSFGYNYLTPTNLERLSFIPDILETIEDDENSNNLTTKQRFIIRNVPGDGSCLFHAITACITHERCKFHIDSNSPLMKAYSECLRYKAVQVLSGQTDIKTLYIDNTNEEPITPYDLLQTFANNEGLSIDMYCYNMYKNSTWGSGAEIVALSNYFQRPICIYQLCSTENNNKPTNMLQSLLLSLLKLFSLSLSPSQWPSQSEHSQSQSFKLTCWWRCGSPTMYDQKEPLHILHADGRFPNILPGQQKESGDHFFALFPLSDTLYTQYKKQIEGHNSDLYPSLYKKGRKAVGLLQRIYNTIFPLSTITEQGTYTYTTEINEHIVNYYLSTCQLYEYMLLCSNTINIVNTVDTADVTGVMAKTDNSYLSLKGQNYEDFVNKVFDL